MNGAPGPEPGELGGRVAVVTGAATGIGRAIALALADRGASVVVNHLDTPEAAAAVVQQIEDLGGSATAVQADISSEHEQARLVAAARDLRPLGHPGRDVVAFLASDRARWITGQIIRVNGGTV